MAARKVSCIFYLALQQHLPSIRILKMFELTASSIVSEALPFLAVAWLCFVEILTKIRLLHVQKKLDAISSASPPEPFFTASGHLHEWTGQLSTSIS